MIWKAFILNKAMFRLMSGAGAALRSGLLMNTRLVITSLAPPGVVIQLDGRAAERLAMTPRGSLPYHGTARRSGELSS
jgi:hypothetical protein